MFYHLSFVFPFSGFCGLILWLCVCVFFFVLVSVSVFCFFVSIVFADTCAVLVFVVLFVLSSFSPSFLCFFLLSASCAWRNPFHLPSISYSLFHRFRIFLHFVPRLGFEDGSEKPPSAAIYRHFFFFFFA